MSRKSESCLGTRERKPAGFKLGREANQGLSPRWALCSSKAWTSEHLGLSSNRGLRWFLRTIVRVKHVYKSKQVFVSVLKTSLKGKISYLSGLILCSSYHWTYRETKAFFHNFPDEPCPNFQALNCGMCKKLGKGVP